MVAGGEHDPWLGRLYALAAAHANGLSPDAAVDWVRHHGLLSLSQCESLRSDIGQRLRTLAEENLVANRVFIWHFQDIVDALGDVPVCALKGIHLLDTVYGDAPEMRTLWDIDLMVPEARIEDALARLGESLGYRESASSYRVRRIDYHRRLSDGRHQLELHTSLGLGLWRRATWPELRPRPMRLHDRQIFALDPPTLLVHLLVHWVHHRPSGRLKWVEDLLRLAATGVDVRQAWARADELGVSSAVVAGVRSLRRHLGGDDLFPDIPSRVGLRTIPVFLNERSVWRDRAELVSSRPGPGRVARNVSALLLADSVPHAFRFVLHKALEVVRR